jgi:hypothetical protein
VRVAYWRLPGLLAGAADRGISPMPIIKMGCPAGSASIAVRIALQHVAIRDGWRPLSMVVSYCEVNNATRLSHGTTTDDEPPGTA